MPHAALDILNKLLRDAKEEHERTKDLFWKTCKDVGRNSASIRAALAQQHKARTAHLEAASRLNQFLLYGIVPQDVKEQLSGQGKAGKPGI